MDDLVMERSFRAQTGKRKAEAFEEGGSWWVLDADGHQWRWVEEEGAWVRWTDDDDPYVREVARRRSRR